MSRTPSSIPECGWAEVAHYSARFTPETAGRAALRRFSRNPLALSGTLLLGVVAVAAVAAPLLVGDPLLIDLRNARPIAPSLAHPLGTDLSGRDVWSRVVYGARVSLAVGFGAVGIYVLIGTTLGLLAGYFGGRVDQVVMRITDSIMSAPPLLMIIVFVSLVGPSLISVIVVIALLGWPGTARLVRGQVLALREAEFITAARVVGVRDPIIVVRHLLPNVFGPVTVAGTFGVAGAILLEAALGFLGLGIRPPTPSWGAMINPAQAPDVLISLPWTWIPPAIGIALTVLAVNFIGDGLRDALDPRS
jgi:peptide/nickel transport system permease protein